MDMFTPDFVSQQGGGADLHRGHRVDHDQGDVAGADRVRVRRGVLRALPGHVGRQPEVQHEDRDEERKQQQWQQLRDIEPAQVHRVRGEGLLIEYIQGDHSGCSLGIVVIKTKVSFWHKEHIVECILCFDINQNWGTT